MIILGPKGAGTVRTLCDIFKINLHKVTEDADTLPDIKEPDTGTIRIFHETIGNLAPDGKQPPSNFIKISAPGLTMAEKESQLSSKFHALVNEKYICGAINSEAAGVILTNWLEFSPGEPGIGRVIDEINKNVGLTEPNNDKDADFWKLSPNPMPTITYNGELSKIS